jgi:preprotein translocase subunit SecA
MVFNLFKKKPTGPTFTDKAFMTVDGKMNACVQLAKADPSAVFLAWFPATVREFRTFFIRHGIEETRVIDTKNLHNSMVENKNAVFVEHFPTHQKELDLVQHWSQQRFVVYSSLDEPLFKFFGSEKMLPLMKMLGMKEDEPIEHALVSKSIVRTQEKIAAKVSLERSAESQEEWMKKNLGERMEK